MFKEIFWLIECWWIVLYPRIRAFLTNLKEIRVISCYQMHRSTDAKEGRKILLPEVAFLAFRCLEFPMVLDYLVSAFVSVWFKVSYCALFAGAIYFSFLCVCVSPMWMQTFMCVCAFTGWILLKKLNLVIWTEQREVSFPQKTTRSPVCGSLLIYRVHYMKMFPSHLQRNGIYPLPEKALTKLNNFILLIPLDPEKR